MASKKYICLSAAILISVAGHAQTYPEGLIDKTVAVVGGEMICISDIENEMQLLRAQGMSSDKNMRCEILEGHLQNKLFLMQARLDSLTVSNDMVTAELNQRVDRIRTQLGGDRQVEEYFGKPIYKLRQEWKTTLQEQSLIQEEQKKIASSSAQVAPYDVQRMLDETDVEDLPVVPIKYQLSQICVYPDREVAKEAVKERLLAIRERVIAGEKFSTLARLYSQDPGSARRGGELGMASRSIFWPAFSDVAMSLKPGVVSQIVETPDGFHLIEVIEKEGDMFNARHILLKPEYTLDDRRTAFARLDSLRTMIVDGTMEFAAAARFFSEDLQTKTNYGQMSDPNTGSAYFEIDQLKPQDYAAVRSLKEGEITEPIESLDNEGRSGNVVYKILRVDKILPAHTATFAHDYDVLQAMAREKKQRDVVLDFIKSKIKVTQIVIDPIFKDCDFENEEWAEKIRNQSDR